MIADEMRDSYFTCVF